VPDREDSPRATHHAFSDRPHAMTAGGAAMALLGGALIGVSASILLVFNRRTAGISGILAGALRPAEAEARWRWAFLAGLLAGGFALRALSPATVPAPHTPLGLAVLSGLLVGLGTRLGSGCTSGHGVCGISRGSLRSLAATVTFMATGALATAAVYHGLGFAR
jgi:uncharacterized membrane protein YedE/YeeE